MKMQLVLLMSALACASCASTSQIESDSSEREGTPMKGVFIEEFERIEFITCEGESYWVANPSALYEVAHQAKQDGSPLSIVALKSEVGSYGHVSRYSQEITVTKAAVSTDKTDCKTLSYYKDGQ